MKAKVFTYSTERLNSTQKSILSKRINGYIDKSNGARYTYKRKGIFEKIPHIKITKKAFIIREQDFSKVSKILRQYGATLKSWNIDIKKI